MTTTTKDRSGSISRNNANNKADYTNLVKDTYFQQQQDDDNEEEEEARQHDVGNANVCSTLGGNLRQVPASALTSGLESDSATGGEGAFPPQLSTSSSLSMSEMFNDRSNYSSDPSPRGDQYSDQDVVAAVGVNVNVHDGILTPSVEDSTSTPHIINRNVNVNSNGMPREESSSYMMGRGTPPMTVYSSAGAGHAVPVTALNSSTPTGFSNSPLDPYAMYGPISPSAGTVTSMDGSSRSNTPTKQQYANFVTGRGTNKIPIGINDAFFDPDSSHQVTGSVSTTASSIRSGESSMTPTPKPLLYSAIGSLEQYNQNSLRVLNNRLLAPTKDFCRPDISNNSGQPYHQQRHPYPLQQYQPSQLIPPVTNYPFHQNQQDSALSSNTEGNLRQVLPGTHQNDTEPPYQQGQGAPSSRKFKGEQFFGVLKNHAKTNFQNVNGKVDGNGATEVDAGNKASTKIQAETKPLQSLLKSTTKKIGASTTDDIPIRGSKISQKKPSKKVSYDANTNTAPKSRKKKQPKKPVEMFRPSSDAYTPRIEKKRIEYKTAEARTPVQHMEMGTLQRPNFRDALRRVAMIIHQHVDKIESRYDGESETRLCDDKGLFRASMRDLFHEDNYRTPTYKVTMTRIPMACPGMVYGLRKIKVKYTIPSETEIYEFAHQLFKSVQLSSECSIVCLIYVERLMEIAKVPLLACTWRPIFMCGLLLASKVWQDVSSWNVEFSSVYPQFSLEAINRLELSYVRNIKWDLYISSSLYAKYYFALRSLVEKNDFRKRYNRMVGGVDSVAQSEALKVQERTERVKEEAILQISRSM
mmetsp:Transcript_52116/g.125842  ORF Transcript_52116/g.125842 Transcript_52116/m.125842 type:complete len:809 (-) Transcript_52116:27-2453(-)